MSFNPSAMKFMANSYNPKNLNYDYLNINEIYKKFMDLLYEKTKNAGYIERRYKDNTNGKLLKEGMIYKII